MLANDLQFLNSFSIDASAWGCSPSRQLWGQHARQWTPSWRPLPHHPPPPLETQLHHSRGGRRPTCKILEASRMSRLQGREPQELMQSKRLTYLLECLQDGQQHDYISGVTGREHRQRFMFANLWFGCGTSGGSPSFASPWYGKFGTC